MLFEKKEDAKGDLLDNKQKLLRMSEVSLILDTYDDIFSDFDPRPYSTRALSDDFLLEVKKATKDKPSGTVELKFMMPHHSRNLVSENLIKRRLKEHFKRHYILAIDDVKKIRNKGISMTLAGVVMLMLSAYLRSLSYINLFTHFFIFLFEPAGWFTAWTGLDQIFYGVREMEPDLKFYEKMSQAEINFLPY